MRDVVDGLLVEHWEGIGWNDFIVEIGMQRVQGHEILIQFSITGLGSVLPKEIKKLTMTRD